MLNSYQIIRLAWGPLLFKTRSFGKVEMRSAKRDTPQERSCLEQSARTFGMSVKAAEANVVENPSVEYCSRIVAIVEAPSAIEALRTATAQFEETLDILETFGSIGRHTLERVGLIHDFSKATREPIRPKAQRASSLAATFDGHTDNLQMMSIEQIILSYDANGRNSYELADRLLRSSYWSRKARSEVNPQLRVLFRWFAIESIWLAKSDDGTANQEDAISPTMWALGFPSKGGSTPPRGHGLDLPAQLRALAAFEPVLRKAWPFRTVS
jgi:hypothetical protein